MDAPGLGQKRQAHQRVVRRRVRAVPIARARRPPAEGRTGRYDETMVGIRWRRFGSNDGVAVMGGASRRMRQYGILQYFLQYGMVILQYCMAQLTLF